MPAGELHRRLQLRGVVHLRDPHRRPEPRGLHEHRIVERALDRVAEPDRVVARDGDAAVAEHRLEQVLVHAERRRRHAGPRRTGRPPARAAPARSRPRRRGRGGSGGRRRRSRASRRPPRRARARAASPRHRRAPSSSGACPGPSAHVPSRPISTVTASYRSGSSSASTDRADAREISCSLERPPMSTATRTLVEGLTRLPARLRARLRPGSSAGGTNRPTTIEIAVPGSACAPPAGSCESTTPSRDGSVVSSSTMFASKPESSSVATAVSWSSERHVGHRRRGRAPRDRQRDRRASRRGLTAGRRLVDHRPLRLVRVGVAARDREPRALELRERRLVRLPEHRRDADRLRPGRDVDPAPTSPPRRRHPASGPGR